jgi:hypothetical protein
MGIFASSLEQDVHILVFSFYVSWHGDIHSSVDVIPIEGKLTMQVPCPILCLLIRHLQACN